MITYLLITAVKKNFTPFKSNVFNIAREKKYKHLKIEGEKMVDFEKRIAEMLLDEKQQKVFLNFSNIA